MNSKSGITMLVLVIAVVIMITLISSASVIGINSINTANFDEYMSKLNRVSNNVNQYYLENNKLPIKNEVVDAESFSETFLNAIISNKDENNKLYVIDMSLIPDSSIHYGSGTVLDKDVFVVAQNTNNVYYLRGFKYKSNTYFNVSK